MRMLLGLLTALATVTAASAQSLPPAKMPPFSPNGFAQPVVIYDGGGNVVSSFGGGSGGTGGGASGSVTSAGANGTTAQAVQGINGGIPFPVTGSFLTEPVFTARFGTLGQKAAAGSAPVVIASDQPALPVTGTFFQVTQPISAATLPLPTGAATGALQTTGNTTLTSIDGKTPTLIGGRQPVDGSGVTQPVSAAALPLPAGAATSALQGSGNASLTSLDAKTAARGRVTRIEGSVSITAATTPQTANNATLTSNASAVQLWGVDAGRTKGRVQNQGTNSILLRLNNAADSTVCFLPAASGSGSVQTKQVKVIFPGAMYETPTDEDVTGTASVCSAQPGQTVAFEAN